MNTPEIKRAQLVEYLSYSVSETTLLYTYLVDNEKYTFTTTLSEPITLPSSLRDLIIKNIGMLYLLDIAEMVLPQKIVIHVQFSENELIYWKEWQKEVTRERIYIDKLPLVLLNSFWELHNVVNSPEVTEVKNRKNAAIICVTGGKESLTALSLLKDTFDLKLLTLDPDANIHRKNAITALTQEFSILTADSSLSMLKKKLYERYNGFQASGFDMGHLVFYALLYADTYRNVIIGNEYGSNLPNVYYEGYPINHQYVKSYEFARSINEYVHSFITRDFHYNSPFFGLYEYKIAEYFFTHDKYHRIWTSCNNATPKKNFCEQCPKCAFSYLLGLRYTDRSYLRQFFTTHLLDTLSLYRDLVSFTALKPLECVGDKLEVWVALYKIYKLGKDTGSETVRYFMSEIYPLIQHQLPEFEKEISTWQNTELFSDELLLPLIRRYILHEKM